MALVAQPSFSGIAVLSDISRYLDFFCSADGLSLKTRYAKTSERLRTVHPGDVLREDFMNPLNLSAYAVAKPIGSTPIAISQICRGRRGISAEMALKLGRLFNVFCETM